MHSVARCDTLSAFIAETYVILEQDSVEVKFDPITRKTLFTALKHLMIYLFLIHDLTCIEDLIFIAHGFLACSTHLSQFVPYKIQMIFDCQIIL